MNNLNYLLNDANYNEFDEDLHHESLPRVPLVGSKKPAVKTPTAPKPINEQSEFKHVSTMTEDEYYTQLRELTDPKLKVTLHTIAKHASDMTKEEYEKELAKIMDVFSDRFA